MEVQPYICGASLVALPPRAGGLRPVAVGETWRRLVAKTMVAPISDALKELLVPLQVGVGVKGAAESIIHACRQWMSRNQTSPQKILIKLDISNAFNSVDRSTVQENIRRVAPEIAPCCFFC